MVAEVAEVAEFDCCSCWRADDDSSVILKKARLNDDRVFDGDAVFYETCEPEKAQQIVQVCQFNELWWIESNLCCRRGLFVDLCSSFTTEIT